MEGKYPNVLMLDHVVKFNGPIRIGSLAFELI